MLFRDFLLIKFVFKLLEKIFTLSALSHAPHYCKTSSSMKKRFSFRNRFVQNVGRASRNRAKPSMFTYCHRSDCSPLCLIISTVIIFRLLSFFNFFMIHQITLADANSSAIQLNFITANVQREGNENFFTLTLILTGFSLFYAPIIILCAFLHALFLSLQCKISPSLASFTLQHQLSRVEIR